MLFNYSYEHSKGTGVGQLDLADKEAVKKYLEKNVLPKDVEDLKIEVTPANGGKDEQE